VFLDLAVEYGSYEVSEKCAVSILKVTQLIQMDASN